MKYEYGSGGQAARVRHKLCGKPMLGVDENTDKPNYFDFCQCPSPEASAVSEEAERWAQPEEWASLGEEIARQCANSYVFMRVVEKITLANVSIETWNQAINLLVRPLFKENERLKFVAIDTEEKLNSAYLASSRDMSAKLTESERREREAVAECERLKKEIEELYRTAAGECI